MITISVYDKKFQKKIMEAADGENLMQLLGRYRVFFKGNCGGNGTCGACEVLVNGQKKKACKYIITGPCNVKLSQNFEEEFESVLFENQSSKDSMKLSHDSKRKIMSASSDYKSVLLQAAELYVAVDLGTTTIAFSLVAKMCDNSRKILATYGIRNQQSIYGADVASRIKAAENKENQSNLTLIARDMIRFGVESLFKHIGTSYQDYIRLSNASNRELGNTSKSKLSIYVSGNTTMLHLLAGHCVSSIGSYPFVPEHPEYQSFSLKDEMMVHLLPCVSGYIGSDITVGACYYGIDKSEEISLFVDLGTNGEMILGNQNKMIATSVAAGPAFERVMTGADALKGLRELLDKGIIDTYGTLQDAFVDHGVTIAGITFTQDNIREIQLAKAAVRAGIELLCEEYNCKIEDIGQVYIAGGFGFYMNLRDAIAIGMLPELFADKCKIVKNSSLEGTIYCQDKIEEIEVFNRKIETFDLAMLPKFQEKYISYMNF